jgi:hypothetical protein
MRRATLLPRAAWAGAAAGVPAGSAGQAPPAGCFGGFAPAAAAAAPQPPGARGFAAARAALVRGLPASFAAGALRQHGGGAGGAIDAARAEEQHEVYTDLLRRLLPRVVEVPADEAHPDCVFIEDTAVVTPDGIAIVTRPGEALAGRGRRRRERGAMSRQPPRGGTKALGSP